MAAWLRRSGHERVGVFNEISPNARSTSSTSAGAATSTASRSSRSRPSRRRPTISNRASRAYATRGRMRSPTWATDTDDPARSAVSEALLESAADHHHGVPVRLREARVDGGLRGWNRDRSVLRGEPAGPALPRPLREALRTPPAHQHRTDPLLRFGARVCRGDPRAPILTGRGIKAGLERIRFMPSTTGGRAHTSRAGRTITSSSRETGCSTGRSRAGRRSSWVISRLPNRRLALRQAQDERGASHFLSRWLFLRVVAAIYAIAFLSIYVQLDGLIGSEGILPRTSSSPPSPASSARSASGASRRSSGSAPAARRSTFVCGGGIALAALAIAGITPAFVFALLWALYLSLVTVGGDFLEFQWDILLLETGFLAIFLSPLGLRPRLGGDPPKAIVCWYAGCSSG